MKNAPLSAIVLIVLNALLGLGGAGLIIYGLFIDSPLTGLGLALLMTTSMCYVGFRCSLEQSLGVKEVWNIKPKQIVNGQLAGSRMAS